MVRKEANKITFVSSAVVNSSQNTINIKAIATNSKIPENTEIDELQTFIGCRKNKVWVWTVVNHWKPGILLWTVGDRSSSSFHSLWFIIKCWHSFWYVTDGWKVYPGFINPEDHLICKTYMTRVQRRLVRRM